MDKMRIVLSCNALRKFTSNPVNSVIALAKIQQHLVLITEDILKKYESFFQDNDEESLFHEWYKLMVGLDVFKLVEEKDADVWKDIKLQFSDYRFPVYIKTSDDSITPDVRNVETFENINRNDLDCRFNRYCIPSSFKIMINDLFDDFKNLLSFMIFDETEIVFVDPFIFDGPHPELFEKLYIPALKSCPSIKLIYSNKYKPSQSTISSIKRKCPQIRLEGKPHKELHDRHICSKTWNISVLYGFKIFDETTKKAIAETQVNISPPNTNPSICGL